MGQCGDSLDTCYEQARKVGKDDAELGELLEDFCMGNFKTCKALEDALSDLVVGRTGSRQSEEREALVDALKGVKGQLEEIQRQLSKQE